MIIEITEGERRKLIAFARSEMQKLTNPKGNVACKKTFENAQDLIDKLNKK